MMAVTNQIFTIGHSAHSIEKFFALLRAHSIQAVADVRSTPFSKFNPQFNRDTLKSELKISGIRYVFLGKELGARSEDPTCYVDKKIQYDRLANTALFKSGIARVIEGSSNYRIALMCAEKDPLDCHRTMLVSRELIKRGVGITHILDNGLTESHGESIERLIARLGLSMNDMFTSKEHAIEQAYIRQINKIAYTQPNTKTKYSDEHNELVRRCVAR